MPTIPKALFPGQTVCASREGSVVRADDSALAALFETADREAELAAAESSLPGSSGEEWQLPDPVDLEESWGGFVFYFGDFSDAEESSANWTVFRQASGRGM